MNVLAFHGTGLSNYENIVKTKSFSFKRRDDHWLGNGVYFFVDDFERAKRWAEGNRPDKNTAPVVIETKFEFKQGELLDLDKSDGLKKLNDFARNFKTELQRKRVLINNTDEHKFHCKLLDAFVYRNKKYKAVCRTMKFIRQSRNRSFWVCSSCETVKYCRSKYNKYLWVKVA